ncbi:MAG TPA: hypothetical protein VH328_15720 [Burkholderiaceae bacterium]|jgi:hypothetical protein|nr:hypothetical protein [Burkholderiaceae bacterium]
MPDDDFYAMPPFNAETAFSTLKRNLRELKLVEREGTYELKGQQVARARLEEGRLLLDIVRRPSGTPEWEHLEARDHAMVRRFLDDLKRRLLRWGEAREE